MKLNIFTDFHYCEFEDSALTKQAQEYYFRFFDDITKNNTDFIFSLGDLATQGNMEHYQTILPRVNKHNNYINVLGNHDTTFIAKKEIQDFFKQELFFTKEFDTYAIICLDSTKEFIHDDWGGIIDRDQLLWLDKEVSRLLDKNLIVLSHHPIANTTFNTDKPMSCIENSDEVMAILNKNNKENLFIAGHVHYNSVVTKKQWHFIQLGATIDTGSYLELIINNDSFELAYKEAPSIRMVDKSFLAHVLHFTPNPNNAPIIDFKIQR